MKTDRLIGILSILLQEEKTTAPELAEKFEGSRRTINRDIEDLCKAGIPIRTAQGTGGGISIMDGYRMDRTILTSKDMQMILAGLRSLDSVSGNRYYGQLMEKIQTGSSEFISERDSMLIDLSSWYKGSLVPKIEVIQNAIENRHTMVIMDECHHAASNTSMELLQKINAKYVYGVSATPKRGDSLDRIIYMLLGPLRHRFTALERAKEQGIGHYFVPRYTRVVDTAESKDNINKAYNLISTSKVRNEMITDDVITCVARKQTPVILTRFKEHAKFLHDALKEKADHVFLLYGDNSDKENAEIRVKLKQIPENESLILVATGQKIGEGFDFPRLDVLMLAAPVSFEGRLEQYVGRLNRDYVGKEAVYVYDYIDSHVRYFDKMYAKRLRTYRKMGFSIWTQELQPKQIINAIFDSVNYTEKFEQDIVESEKMVVISSPDIRQDKIDRFLLLIKKRQEVGVKVTVITTDPEDITYGKSDVCYELIRAMQLVGINVITRTEVEECFAVIDDEIVWHGGMNLLGKADVWDNLMRIRNSQVATELLEIALGCSEEGRKSE